LVVLAETNLYHNLWDFTRIGDFTWRLSDLWRISGGGQSQDIIRQVSWSFL